MENSNMFAGLMNLGGAVVVTALFLFYLWKRGDKTEELVRQVTSDFSSLERNSQEHNRLIADTFTAQVRENSSMVREMFHQQFETMKENTRAVGELKVAVNNLQTAMVRLQDERLLHGDD